ncbi:heme-degrading domain-containing protein [Leptothrix discophora]|uniref:Heme-degrading domain-containing protein n=1 Tax=Leptothrix discophora TaxID=89 RepID=A0ABT9G6Z2_LEPDI|nr:heme-degrading domain-containing protein [Leptothrix discophora]MDP4302263.1 heme-degrading domain-containing protein [Leptothrix discophora]
MNPDPELLRRDLARIAEQEARLRLPTWNEAIAWQLGCCLRERAAARGVAITIEARLARETVFLCAMPGTAPTNADWARRKRNAVETLQRSSYAIGLQLALEGVADLEVKLGLPLRDHANAGGCFPIRLADGGACVGTLTVSGLPQRDDHDLVVEVLAEHLGIALETVALAR